MRLAHDKPEGPVWAYHDFADGPLEDVLFRIASPAVRDRWTDPGERALYVLIKERTFGAGCVEAWERNRAQLFAQAGRLLAPTLQTLAARPFLFGDAPTVADAALYGQCKMVEEGDPARLVRLGEGLGTFMKRLERSAPLKRSVSPRGPRTTAPWCRCSLGSPANGPTAPVFAKESAEDPVDLGAAGVSVHAPSVIAHPDPVCARDHPVIAHAEPVCARDHPVIAHAEPACACDRPVIARADRACAHAPSVLARPDAVCLAAPLLRL